MSDDSVIRVAFDRSSRYRREPFESIAAPTSFYLVKGMLPRRGIAFYSGQSRAGKTFVCLDHCLKIAAGASVMGRRAKQMGVVYVAAEDPDGCRTRIDAWKKKYPRGSYTPFELIGSGVDLSDPASVDDLKGAIRDAADWFNENDHDLGVVVFDTLAKCIPGADENSSSDMSRAIQAIEAIAVQFDCLAVAVAHHGKNDKSGIRGWSGQIGAADAIVTVSRDEETGERTIGLEKVKNGPDGDRIAFTLTPAPIGVFDEDGEEVWSCTVSYDGPADKVARSARVVALKPAEEIMLQAIRWTTDNGATQAVPAKFEARTGTKAVRRTDVYARLADLPFAEEGETEAAFAKRRSRAVTALQAKARIRVEGDLLWLL